MVKLLKNPVFQNPIFRYSVSGGILLAGFYQIAAANKNSLYGFTINKYIRKPMEEEKLKPVEEQRS